MELVNNKKVVLDLHDFSIANNRMDILLKLKRRFPKFKVTLFMIPFDLKVDWGPVLIKKENLALIKKNLDWMQIVPHGINHRRGEMLNYDYAQFKHEIIPMILDKFGREEIPVEQGFCAPHWEWSKGVVDGLDEMLWWGAVKREEKNLLPKKYYKYDYLLNEEFWKSDKEVIKIHGHIYGTDNDIGRCYKNMLKLSKDTEFDFVNNHLSYVQ